MAALHADSRHSAQGTFRRTEGCIARSPYDATSSVIWWYAGPIWLGVTLFMVGPLSLWPAVIAVLLSTVFMGLIVWLNRAAVRTQIDPRIAELEALIAG